MRSVQLAGSRVIVVKRFTVNLDTRRGDYSDGHFPCPVVSLHDDGFNVFGDLDEFGFAAFEDRHFDLFLSE